MKTVMREQLATVLPLQGHYALDARLVSSSTPAADIRVARIGDLVDMESRLLNGGSFEQS